MIREVFLFCGRLSKELVEYPNPPFFLFKVNKILQSFLILS